MRSTQNFYKVWDKAINGHYIEIIHILKKLKHGTRIKSKALTKPKGNRGSFHPNKLIR